MLLSLMYYLMQLYLIFDMYNGYESKFRDLVDLGAISDGEVKDLSRVSYGALIQGIPSRGLRNAL